MNSIDKLIFDKLAAGQGVNLPDVGALYVERDPARFISRSEIRPPQNKVLFSRRRAEDFDSVIDLIMATNDVKRPEATKIYKEWLTKSKEAKDVVEMNSVGVLTNDSFYPSAILHDTLNPAGREPVALKSRSNNFRTTLITVISILSAAVIVLYILFGLHMCQGPEEYKDGAVAGQAVQQDRAAENRDAGVANTATTQAAVERPAEDVIQQSLEQYAGKVTETAPKVTHTPSVPMYYVVVGVFTSEYNANKLIEDDYFRAGRNAYTKMPYLGRTMVTVFSSPNRSAAFARREQLLDIDYDIWVYTKE